MRANCRPTCAAAAKGPAIWHGTCGDSGMKRQPNKAGPLDAGGERGQSVIAGRYPRPAFRERGFRAQRT
jgi:hypothetical protein